jgi:hypothetical protein
MVQRDPQIYNSTMSIKSDSNWLQNVLHLIQSTH